MTTYDTLGKLRSGGYTLSAHCNGQFCGHGRALDLDKLIEQFGADYVIINETRIGKALVCSSCKHRGARVILSPPTYSSYAAAKGR